MDLPFRALCINDKAKPCDIPLNQWIKEGKLYTVTNVVRLTMTGGNLGFKLAEVNLDGCFPFEYYAASRFAAVFNPELITEFELKELLREAVEEEKNEELDSNTLKKAGFKEKMAE